MTCIFIAITDSVTAQVPGTGTVGFMNKSHMAVIVKGYTVVKGTPVPGQLIPLKKDGKGFETNVPAGIRFYTVYDANNPTRVLLRDQPLPINRDIILMIRTSPLDPTRVVIVPATP
jgi:hypothetical protein